MPGPRVAKQRKKLVDDVARLLAGRRQRTRGGVRNARMPSTAKPVYYGQLRAGSPVRITATHNSIAYTLWTGYTKEWTCSQSRGNPAAQRASLKCTDLAGLLICLAPVIIPALMIAAGRR